MYFSYLHILFYLLLHVNILVCCVLEEPLWEPITYVFMENLLLEVPTIYVLMEN